MNDSKEALLAAAFGCVERTFVSTSSMALSINVHFSGFIGRKRAWPLSQAVSRSLARDLAPDKSPARTRLSISSAIFLKADKSPSGAVGETEAAAWVRSCERRT